MSAGAWREDRAILSEHGAAAYQGTLNSHAYLAEKTMAPTERPPSASVAVEIARIGNTMSVGTILLIIIVIALLGGFSGLGGGPFYGTGYYGGGGLGLLLIIVLVLVFSGRL